ncbi:PAS domain-containing protein, partial [Streptomyces sp. NPDC056728]
MDVHEPRPDREGDGGAGAAPPGGLLDLLSVAAVVLDDAGRIVFWSPQADEVFGYTAEEALGRYAARLLVHEEQRDLVVKLFAEVMGTGESWAGAFPIRHKDGSTRLVEFRNMRLVDDLGDIYALGIAADQSTLQRVETDLALSQRLVSQAPIGIALLDTKLRYVLVNPELERINGVSAADHLGQYPHDILTSLDVDSIESAMRRVLLAGTPLIDQHTVGRTLADPDHDHAWSVSHYRLEDSGGRVIGVANSVIDVSERHRAAAEADRARHRLTMIADASARVGTTLEVEHTAQELVKVAVPDLADIASVDVLDAAAPALRRCSPSEGPKLFRPLAVAAAYPTPAAAALQVVDRAPYGTDRLITQCVHTGRPVVAHAGQQDLE